MPKTKNAFALRDFDSERILQRRYFKAFHFNGTQTDIEILETLKAVTTDSLDVLERKSNTLKAISKLIICLDNLIGRHMTRLHKFGKCKAKKIGSKDGAHRGGVPIEYFTASLDLNELWNKVASAYYELEKEIEKRYRQELAGRLKKARIDAGLTQKELGDMVHVSPPGFSRYERADRDIPLHTMVRLAKVLNLSGDQILGLSDK